MGVGSRQSKLPREKCHSRDHLEVLVIQGEREQSAVFEWKLEYNVAKVTPCGYN